MEESTNIPQKVPVSIQDELRSSYLELVREFPPDRAPERFAEILAAYDEARKPTVRLERMLFSLATRDSLDALEGEIRRRLQAAHHSVEGLLSLADAP